jgi:hypothetical protein
MATFTVTSATIKGNMRCVAGTFTTTAGDTSVSLANSTHGLNYIEDATISLDTGGLDTQQPKIAISSGTVTATFDNTRGYSGRFYVSGK